MDKANTSEWIDLTIDHLNQATPFYQDLDPQIYRNNDLPPYFSSVGKHLRHILDVYACIITGMKAGTIDLTRRGREAEVERDQEAAYQYHQHIIVNLEQLGGYRLTTSIPLIDDMGGGNTLITTNFAAVLMQAYSHSTHHYATINYLLYSQGVNIQLAAFGYNPTTPVVCAS